MLRRACPTTPKGYAGHTECFGHNALAETISGLYKAEVIHKDGPWRGLDDVERATLIWVDWFNHHRLLRAIGDVPPAEFEMMYHQKLSQAMSHASNKTVSDKIGVIQS